MFDVIEARINRVAMAKFANAVAIIAGRDVPVVFDAEYKRGMVGSIGMGAQAPQMVMSSADVPPEFIDSLIVIRQSGASDTQWSVQDREPDGISPSGLATIYLVRS